MTDNVQRIEAALRKLPVAAWVDQRSISLRAMEIYFASLVADTYRVPLTQDSTRKQAIEELLEFARKVCALKEHIRTMRAPALKACEAVTPPGYKQMTTFEFQATNEQPGEQSTAVYCSILQALEDMLEGAFLNSAAAISHIRADDSSDRKGGPNPKKAARLICDSACRAYGALTDKAPTRHVKEVKVNEYTVSHNETGPLLALVTEIFGILGVKEKPAGQLRLWKQLTQKTAS